MSSPNLMEATMNKHLRECVQLCATVGLEILHIEYRGGGHIALYSDKGPLFCASSPSDRRARLNLRAQARRMARG